MWVSQELTVRTAVVEQVRLTLRQALAPLAHKTYSFCNDRQRMRQRAVFLQAFSIWPDHT